MPPPCASMMALAIPRPIPVPFCDERFCRPRKNLSKTKGCSAGSMVVPFTFSVEVLSTQLTDGICADGGYGAGRAP